MGGGGTKIKQVQAQLAPASSEQKQLLKNQMNWFDDLSPAINSLTSLGTSSLSQIPQFDFGQMYQNNLGAQKNIQSGYDGLAQGKLPEGWADEQASYIGKTMNNALGSTMAKWADKGLVNSSLAQRSFGDVSGWAASELQKNYLNNLSAAGSALGNSMQSLWAPMQYAQDAQNAAWTNSGNAFNLAGSLNQPILDLYMNLLNQQTALSSPAQTIVSQKSSPWGAIGSLAGSLGSAAIMCFPKGTLIDTAYGAVPIEKIEELDAVYNEDFAEEVVVNTYQGVKPELYVMVTDQGTLRATEGQRVMTAAKERKRIEEIQVGEQLMHKEGFAVVESLNKELGEVEIYELDTTGNNLFWADGFLVEGMV